MVKKSRRQKCKRKTRRQRGGSISQNHITVYPPSSIKQYIENVIYINLDSRTDRRKHIEKELQIFDKSQIHRVPGIVSEIQDNKHRALAITKTHLNAIKLAKNSDWSNVLVTEDDAYWANIERAYPAFEKLIQKTYDVIMLGSQRPKYNKDTFRVEESYGAHAYLVNKTHYDILIKKLEELIGDFNPKTPGFIDAEHDTMVFRPLQREYNWFIVIPSLMNQLPGHSNRLEQYVNYKNVEPM
jgi:hypothetical protein